MAAQGQILTLPWAVGQRPEFAQSARTGIERERELQVHSVPPTADEIGPRRQSRIIEPVARAPASLRRA